jgi:hypothetical protein
MTTAAVQQGSYHADVGARVELGAPLPYDDIAGDSLCAAAEFHAQHLGVGVLAVLRAASRLLRRAAAPQPTPCHMVVGMSWQVSTSCQGTINKSLQCNVY